MKKVATVFFSTGSNQGSRLKALVEACVNIDLFIGKVEVFSSIFETEPLGFASDNRFYNQVLKVNTILDPKEILRITRDIEAQMGRKQSGIGYADRNIDIDMLFYDNRIINGEDLIIPHPRMHQRDFVLWPMAEIEPGYIHPVLMKRIDELKELLPQERKIKKAVSSTAFMKKWQSQKNLNF